jgi:hypothetical protein
LGKKINADFSTTAKTTNSVYGLSRLCLGSRYDVDLARAGPLTISLLKAIFQKQNNFPA